ncbi:MAG: Crp/Fnr family transcriptional regulator [Bacteroidaceae bacterium]|nr:Crp/Fnr family transcriptional regulator [Bacteroidaceae bacterium]
MVPIYDRLLELPLFQGHSREDLTAILTKIKVDFRNYRAGQTIVGQDDPCRYIILLMEGDISLSRTSVRKDLTFVERFTAPKVIGAETIFGLRQNHTHAVKAVTEVKTLMLSKQNIIDHLFSFDVFRYNMLNLLTTRIQRSNHMLWASHEHDTLARFIALIKRNFTYHGGPKQIDGGMVALAHMMDDTRIHISDMLNYLQEKGLVVLARKRIEIPHLENIITFAATTT